MKPLACFALLFATTLPAWAADDCRIAQSGNDNTADQRWKGPCKDGWAEGVGVLEKKGENGWRYEGAMLRGEPSGHGYFKFDSGKQLEGEFVHGKLEGMGIYLGPSGDRYDGAFKANRREGRGSMTYALGGRYDGDWKHDQYNGHGIVEYPGGRKLDTTFVNGLPIGQKPVAAAPAASKPSYHLNNKELTTGSLIPQAVVSNSDVPLEKSYAQLNDDERTLVKARYPLMDEADEPPYPLNGPAQAERWLFDANRRTNSVGELRLNVMVDSEGKALSVATYAAPDKEMAQFAARVFMLEKYKPALCAGTPCPMAYPVHLMFKRAQG